MTRHSQLTTNISKNNEKILQKDNIYRRYTQKGVSKTRKKASSRWWRKARGFFAMMKERKAIEDDISSGVYDIKDNSEQNQYTHQESAFMGNSITKYKKPLETNENTPTESIKKSDEIIDIIAPKIAQKIVHPLGMAHWMYVATLMTLALWLAWWIYNPMGQIILIVFWIWIAITWCLGWYLFFLMFSIQIMRFESIQWDIWMTTLLWVLWYPIFRFFFYMYRSFTTWSIL